MSTEPPLIAAERGPLEEAWAACRRARGLRLQQGVDPSYGGAEEAKAAEKAARAAVAAAAAATFPGEINLIPWRQYRVLLAAAGAADTVPEWAQWAEYAEGPISEGVSWTRLRVAAGAGKGKLPSEEDFPAPDCGSITFSPGVKGVPVPPRGYEWDRHVVEVGRDAR